MLSSAPHLQAQPPPIGDYHFDIPFPQPPPTTLQPEADREGNCAEADFVHVDSARNVIFDARAKKNRNPIAVVGLRDCVIVQTDDTTLVAHKKATAKMRDLVAKLAADKAYRKLT